MTDFAKLVPVNVAAQQLFSRTVKFMLKQSDSFHLQFIDDAITDKGESSIPHGHGDSSTEYASSSPSDSDIQRGHYLLSLQQGKLPSRLAQGWRVGKGNSQAGGSNVDFLLAPAGDSKRRYLANVHMFFRFNVRSGMLMLVAAHSDRQVHFYVDGEWNALSYPAKRVLHLRSNKLRLYQYEYDLVYTVSPAETPDFLATRSAQILAYSNQTSLSDNLWSVPPNAEFRKVGSVYVCQTRACGGFGWVCEGVDSLTGDPVAVKELAIKNRAVRDQVFAEAEIGKALQDLPGLLPTLHIWCEHDESRPCGRIPEKVFISSPLARTDFASQDWGAVDYEVKIRLFWRTLKGLQVLHQRGIMHRDITRRNLLIISLNPVDAALCDYGKATSAQQSADTSLGPVHTLAPEVWAESSYTNSIDVWAWAYAMTEVLGYRYRGNDRINAQRLAEIHQWLSIRATSTEHEAELVGLVYSMLSWEPEERTTVDSALQHSCWATLSGMVPDASDDDEETLRPRKVQIVAEPEIKEVDQPSKEKLPISNQRQEEHGPRAVGEKGNSKKVRDRSTPSTEPLSPPPDQP